MGSSRAIRAEADISRMSSGFMFLRPFDLFGGAVLAGGSAVVAVRSETGD